VMASRTRTALWSSLSSCGIHMCLS
jgi:hypothetical protein